MFVSGVCGKHNISAYWSLRSLSEVAVIKNVFMHVVMHENMKYLNQTNNMLLTHLNNKLVQYVWNINTASGIIFVLWIYL